MNALPDARAQELFDWASAALERQTLVAAPASADASFRRYFRLSDGARSWIAMDSPPEREPLDAFIDVAGRLSSAGLNVPSILAEDRSRGFALLSDLGDRPWHRVLDDFNADAMFDDALDALVRMQIDADVAGLPDFDAARLIAELSLFVDWFLASHWGVEPSESELDDWELICMTLVRWALDQPQVFCHRDFMPRNLMLAEPNPGILDFQDAARGPIAYDATSLFRDAFLSWPAERVDVWLESYRLKAIDAGLPVPRDARVWRRTCDLTGTQRHLKVLGVFARLKYRDGKPGYLSDEPRFFGYLAAAVRRNPELAPLDTLLKTWRARAKPKN